MTAIRDEVVRPAAPSRPTSRLVAAGRIGFGLIGAQFAAMCAFSVYEWDRFSLTFDFTTHYQSYSLIAGGHFNPFNTNQGYAYLHDHVELIMWPIDWVMGHIFATGLVLLVLQDAAVAGAGAVVFAWVLDLVRRPTWSSRLTPAMAVSLTLVLLLANPWSWFGIAWDFHMEAFGALFVVLLLRDIERRRAGWAAVWLVLLLSTSDVAGTYAVGVGITALLWRRWRPAAAVTAAGLAWVGGLAVLHAASGSNLQNGYAYLAYGSGTAAHGGVVSLALGIAAHPQHLVAALWDRRLDLWANLGPGGLIGLLTPIGAGTPVLTLLGGILHGRPESGVFGQPSFQHLPAYIPLALASVLAVGAVGRRWSRRPWLAPALAVLLAVNTLAWAVVWLPGMSRRWVRVSAPAAAVLTRADAMIPHDSEVIVSQGIMGRFSDRRFIYPIFGFRTSYPVMAGDIWFVLAPGQGVEPAPVAAALAAVSQAAALPGASIAVHGAGIWVVRWRPPVGQRVVRFAAAPTTVPGWTSAGVAGVSVLVGAQRSWTVSGSGQRGYVVSGDYFRSLPGYYRAKVAITSEGPANVELWNSTADQLLWRQSVEGAPGVQTAAATIQLERTRGVAVPKGWGPFSVLAVPAFAGDDLEIRVWTPGGVAISVGDLSLTPVRAP